MNSSLPIFKVMGVEIRLHWTWVILLAFITVALGETLAVGVENSANVPVGWAVAGMASLFILLSVVAHELAHVRAGLGGGQTPSVVVVQLLGGTYVMDARPATARQELGLATAGPLVNFAFVLAFGLVAGVLNVVSGGDETLLLFSLCAAVPAFFNLFMALVSLIPSYPLDGARVVHAIAWARTGRQEAATRTATRSGRISGYVIMVAGLLFTGVMGWSGLALILAGWLLVGSSRLLERRLAIEEMVGGATVGSAVVAAFGRVPAQLTLDVFAGEYLGERRGSAAIVERGTEPVGLLGTAQIRRIPMRRWQAMRAEQAMVPIASVPRLKVGDRLWPALEALERSGLDALIVDLEDGSLGLITRVSVSAVVKERVQRQAGQERPGSKLRKVLGTNVPPGSGDPDSDEDHDEPEGGVRR